ncbi:hypothetical protein [Streptomyces sp. NPDC056160]|uniref:hypothetical protein n=1 Tax=Streptomyces sp. NPDC056160 TaxID=3345731 RepID=UPI0035DF1B2A
MATSSKKDRVPRYVSQEPETTGPSRNALLNRYGLGGEDSGESERERRLREWEEQQEKKLKEDSGPVDSGPAESGPSVSGSGELNPADSGRLPESSSPSQDPAPTGDDDSSTEFAVTHPPAHADEHGYVTMPRFSAPTSQDKKERLQHYLRGIGEVEYAAKSNEQRVQQQRLLVLGEYIIAMKEERAWEAGGYTTLGQLLFESFGIRKDYANKVERAVPVVRALESVTTMDLKERQLRVLVPVQRDHGDEAVRKVWEEASRRGKLTEKSLQAAAKFLGFGLPEAAPAQVVKSSPNEPTSSSTPSGDPAGDARPAGGGAASESGTLPVADVLRRIREVRSTDEEQAKVMLKELMSAVEELRAEMGIDADA